MNFDEASQAHFEWKTKLRKYLARPDGSQEPAAIALDNQCPLGAWIHGDGRKFAADPGFNELRTVHAGFHREAAALVRRANGGEKVDAEAALGAASPFSDLSQRVVILILEMKRKSSVLGARETPGAGRS